MIFASRLRQGVARNHAIKSIHIRIINRRPESIISSRELIASFASQDQRPSMIRPTGSLSARVSLRVAKPFVPPVSPSGRWRLGVIICPFSALALVARFGSIGKSIFITNRRRIIRPIVLNPSVDDSWQITFTQQVS